MKKIILGHFLNPISDKRCELVIDGALVVENGKVVQLAPKSKIKIDNSDKIEDFSGHLIVPAFFDMHFHWVQDDVREMPKANLLEWLDKYTFPAESKFKSKSYAKKKAKFFFQRLINTGTLGGACYSSIHEHALEYAMEHAKGDFVIGNVLMTINSPKFLSQTSEAAVDIVKRMSGKYKSRYALTPRFAIATDPETMKATAKFAKKNGSFIQTHLSETKGEIDFVTGLYKTFKGFEKAKTYTDIYEISDQLGPKTIMGHGIHLSPGELKQLSKTKTSIAHCPTSNAPIRNKGLGSGLFDFKKAEKYGVKWALASDIGGGPFLSMLDVMRSFVDQNHARGINEATYTKALFRSTVAGAKILEVDKRVGNFDKNKEANFVVLKKLRVKDSDTAENLLKRVVHSAPRSKLDCLPQGTFYKGELCSK